MFKFKKKYLSRENSDISLIATYIYSQYLNIGLGFIVAIIVSHFSIVVVAGYGIATLLYSLFNIFFYGIMTSAGVMLAQAMSNGKIKKSIKIMVNSLIIGFVIGFVFLLFLLYSHLWIALFISNKEVSLIAISYFHGAAIGAIPNVVSIVIVQLMSGLNKSDLIAKTRSIKFFIIPATVSISCIFINKAPETAGFLLGFCIGIGYLITFLITVVILKKYILKMKGKFLRSYFAKIAIDKSLIKKIILNGLPTGIILSLEIAYHLLILLILGRISEKTQAVFYIISQINLLLRTLPYAVSLAVTFRCAYIGIKKYRLMESYVINVSKALLICGLVIGLAMSWFGLSVFKIFPDIYALRFNNGYAVELKISLVFTCILFLLEIVRYNILGLLRGVRDTFLPMLITIIGFWLVALPVGYLFNYLFGTMFVGYLAGETIGLFLISILLIYRYFFVRLPFLQIK